MSKIIIAPIIFSSRFTETCKRRTEQGAKKVPDARAKEKKRNVGEKETCTKTPIERSDRNQLQRNGKSYNYDWQIELWGSNESCQYIHYAYMHACIVPRKADAERQNNKMKCHTPEYNELRSEFLQHSSDNRRMPRIKNSIQTWRLFFAYFFPSPSNFDWCLYFCGIVNFQFEMHIKLSYTISFIGN